MNSFPLSHRRRAFTIIEVMVVVGIIVLLAAILLPSLGAFRRHAEKAAAISLMNTIRTGLNQYFTDHGMYPPSSSPDPPPSSPVPVGAYGGKMNPYRGQAMLAQGLLGWLPGDADYAGPTTVPALQPLFDKDPLYGFRTRAGTMGGTKMIGQIYGPYVPPDPKYVKVNPATANPNGKPWFSDHVFIDPWGHEILYYRSVRAAGSSAPYKPGDVDGLKDLFGDPSGAQGTPLCLFAFRDCWNDSSGNNMLSLPTSGGVDPDTGQQDTTGLRVFYGMIKVVVPQQNMNAITVGSPILGADSFLLISAGADGIYFNADDIVMSKQ